MCRWSCVMKRNDLWSETLWNRYSGRENMSWSESGWADIEGREVSGEEGGRRRESLKRGEVKKENGKWENEERRESQKKYDDRRALKEEEAEEVKKANEQLHLSMKANEERNSESERMMKLKFWLEKRKLSEDEERRKAEWNEGVWRRRMTVWRNERKCLEERNGEGQWETDWSSIIRGCVEVEAILFSIGEKWRYVVLLIVTINVKVWEWYGERGIQYSV